MNEPGTDFTGDSSAYRIPLDNSEHCLYLPAALIYPHRTDTEPIRVRLYAKFLRCVVLPA